MRKQLALEELPVTALRPNPRNARTHTNKQIRQIAQSFRKFGFNAPVLIDEDNMILAGHARIAAAKEAGFSEVPCRRISGLTRQQKRAYALADNRHAENAGWDEEVLAIEVAEILEANPDFDVGAIGFDYGDIDLIIETPRPAEKNDPDDEQLPPLQGKAVSGFGDLWALGEHRLYCGNALKASSFEAVLGRDRAQMVFSDPPYNVPIDGHVSGRGKTKHPDFAMASGEMSKKQFTHFLTAVFGRCADHAIDGSIHFHCMDWRHMEEILQAGQSAYDELKNLCVWVKDNGGMGSFYRSRHELVFVFKNGAAAHINTFGLGQNGRYRTNVWNYRGANTGGRTRLKDLALHPTVKPVAMIADAMRDCSARGGVVLDPFGGSGSTLIAAERTKRRARLIEIDPIYVDRTIRRWEKIAHDDAVHVATGQTFAERKQAMAEGALAATPGRRLRRRLPRALRAAPMKEDVQ